MSDDDQRWRSAMVACDDPRRHRQRDAGRTTGRGTEKEMPVLVIRD